MEVQTADRSRARYRREDTWHPVHRSPPHLAAALPALDLDRAVQEKSDSEESTEGEI